MLFLKLQSWLYVLCKLDSPDPPEVSSLFSASYSTYKKAWEIISTQFKGLQDSLLCNILRAAFGGAGWSFS